MSFEIWESAKEEFISAYSWYEDRSIGLGEEFAKTISSYYKKIKKNPYQYHERESGFRAVVVHGFPYLIVFGIEDETITIYSIFHTSRNPEPLSKRIGGKRN